MGFLSANFVGNFSLLITWEAPFSLNLTNTEPNITYNVLIRLNSDGHLDIHSYSFDETMFLYTQQAHDHCNSLLHNAIYNITVIPVNGAGQGISKQLQVQCEYL